MRLAWGLGALVALGSSGMYLASRTVGLPGQAGEEWLEWSGIIALTSQAIALVATVLGLRLIRAAHATRAAGAIAASPRF